MYIADKKIYFSFEGVDFCLNDFRVQILKDNYPMHSHSENSYEIHFFPSGRGQMIIDDHIANLEHNTVIVTGPKVMHEQRPSGDVLKYSLYLTVEKNNPSSLIDIFLNTKTYVGKYKPNVQMLLNELKSEFENKDIGYILNAQNIVRGILINLMRSYKSTGLIEVNKDYDNNIIFKIEAIFLNEFNTITLEELASRVSMSIRGLQRFLYRHYKKSFIELRVEARMNYAIYMLKNKDASIEEISNLCGYSTREHFTQTFKKTFNISPLKFRQKNKGLQR